MRPAPPMRLAVAALPAIAWFAAPPSTSAPTRVAIHVRAALAPPARRRRLAGVGSLPPPPSAGAPTSAAAGPSPRRGCRPRRFAGGAVAPRYASNGEGYDVPIGGRRKGTGGGVAGVGVGVGAGAGVAADAPPRVRPDADDPRSIEADAVRRIRRCRSVREVERILRGSSPTAAAAGGGAGGSFGAAEAGAAALGYGDAVGPNAAAAALRRVVELRARGGTDGGGEDGSVEVGRRIVPPLMTSVWRAIVAEESRDGDEDGTAPSPALTAYALQDFLFSLARLRELRKRSGGPAANRSRGGGDLTPLAERACDAILSTDGGSSYIRTVGPRRLVDTLWALAVLGANRRAELPSAIGDHLRHGRPTGRLSGRELSLALWSCAALDGPHPGLIKSFARRLRKRPVREATAPSDLARALWAAGRSVERLDAAAAAVEGGAAGGDTERPRGAADVDLQAATVRGEAETMCYTLTNELLRPRSGGGGGERSDGGGGGRAPLKLESLTAGQVADVLSACVTFEMDNSTAVLGELSSHLKQEKVLCRCTCKDISRLLLSFQRLHMVQEVETVKALGRRFLSLVRDGGGAARDPKTLNTILRSAVMLLPGDRNCTDVFFDAAGILLLEDGQASSRRASSGEDGEQIRYDWRFLARCNEFEVSNFIWALAKGKRYDKQLLLALADRMMEKDIVDRCSPSSVSRILWSYTTVLSHKEGSDESGDLSTPSPDEDEDEDDIDTDMRGKQYELFQTLGGALLSSRLTPVDASSAMWAMAKASYPLDMGIFDHLAEVLADDRILERATVRQVAQALWACGKMVSWEDPLREKHMGGGSRAHRLQYRPPPPYLDSARRYATFLLSLRGRMTPKDAAQSVWALGRLGVRDAHVVAEFASVAADVAPGCNSQEVSNILWGLSKLGFSDRGVVDVLTQRLTDPSVIRHCSSQEAASAMYALGKMKVRDRDAFAVLSSVIMDRLTDASARAIANALWAYEAVNIVPPRAMLNSWANQYLGIVGLHHNQTNEMRVLIDEVGTD